MIQNISAECLEYLKSEHAAPGRFYHNWNHVEALIEWSRPHEILGVLRTAAMFHDAVYDVSATDNEERSAELLKSMLPKSTERDMAIDCILHCKTPFMAEDNLGALFTDIDHAILGASRPAYMRYSSAVMAEYIEKHAVEVVQFGRAQFLEGLIKRGRVFRTEWFEQMLGPDALTNMTAELHYLTQASRHKAAP